MRCGGEQQNEVAAVGVGNLVMFSESDHTVTNNFLAIRIKSWYAISPEEEGNCPDQNCHNIVKCGIESSGILFEDMRNPCNIQQHS